MPPDVFTAAYKFALYHLVVEPLDGQVPAKGRLIATTFQLVFSRLPVSIINPDEILMGIAPDILFTTEYYPLHEATAKRLEMIISRSA